MARLHVHVGALAGLDHPELARVAHDRRPLVQRPLLRQQLACCASSELTRLVSCAAWARADISASPAFRPIQPTMRDHHQHHEPELAIPADLGDRQAMATCRGRACVLCDLDVRAFRAAAV